MNDSGLYERRVGTLRERMGDDGVDVALITDEDSIYYFSGYHSYLYMDFGRPSFFVLWRDGDAAIITPAMELEMTRRMSWVEDVRPWQDGVGGEWRDSIDDVMKSVEGGKLGVDFASTPPVVREFLAATPGCASGARCPSR